MMSAITTEGAYPLDQIIPAEEWENLDVPELKASAKKVKDEEALPQQKYPNFVLSRLSRIRVEGDKEGNEKRARILVYLRHLFTSYVAHSPPSERQATTQAESRKSQASWGWSPLPPWIGSLGRTPRAGGIRSSTRTCS